MVDMVEEASGESNRCVLVRNPQSDSPQVIENMVELVGIEPTTSSLRTMRSPIFPRLQSITYIQCWYIPGIEITSARCSPTTPKGNPKAASRCEKSWDRVPCGPPGVVIPLTRLLPEFLGNEAQTPALRINACDLRPDSGWYRCSILADRIGGAGVAV
jgi:hypothetical protein